jgi:hypothetical protein
MTTTVRADSPQPGPAPGRQTSTPRQRQHQGGARPLSSECAQRGRGVRPTHKGIPRTDPNKRVSPT